MARAHSCRHVLSRFLLGSLTPLQMLTDVIGQDPQTCPHVLENR